MDPPSTGDLRRWGALLTKQPERISKSKIFGSANVGQFESSLMRGVLAAINASNADPIRRRPLNGSVKPSRMNALQSPGRHPQREMPQHAALSWRYFSDIFASIGVISVPTPRYRKWVAWVNLHTVSRISCSAQLRRGAPQPWLGP